MKEILYFGVRSYSKIFKITGSGSLGIIIIIITLFIADDFQMYKLKCENYNNLQYIYTYIKIHKS